MIKIPEVFDSTHFDGFSYVYTAKLKGILFVWKISLFWLSFKVTEKLKIKIKSIIFFDLKKKT